MIEEFINPGMESNCFLVGGDRLVLIDSGVNPGRMLARIGELGLGLDVLINTHCHYDHVAGNAAIVEGTGATIAAYGPDADALEDADGSLTLSDMFNTPLPRMDVGMRMEAGETIDLGGVTLEVIHTPGHTAGSVSLFEPVSGALFTGDLVFADGVGRTDLPGGDWTELEKSIEGLLALNEERSVNRVCPGHGRTGTIDDVARVHGAVFKR